MTDRPAQSAPVCRCGGSGILSITCRWCSNPAPSAPPERPGEWTEQPDGFPVDYVRTAPPADDEETTCRRCGKRCQDDGVPECSSCLEAGEGPAEQPARVAICDLCYATAPWPEGTTNPPGWSESGPPENFAACDKCTVQMAARRAAEQPAPTIPNTLTGEPMEVPTLLSAQAAPDGGRLSEGAIERAIEAAGRRSIDVRRREDDILLAVANQRDNFEKVIAAKRDEVAVLEAKLAAERSRCLWFAVRSHYGLCTPTEAFEAIRDGKAGT